MIVMNPRGRIISCAFSNTVFASYNIPISDQGKKYSISSKCFLNLMLDQFLICCHLCYIPSDLIKL